MPVEAVVRCLHTLRSLLQVEAHASAPHLCARHVSTFHMYTTLAQVTSRYFNDEILHETLDIFRILLDSEEGDFVKDTGFADALIGFMSMISNAAPLTVDTTARMLEVMFGIAAKVRLQPEVLPAWFKPKSRNYDESNPMDKDDFPLFYLTLDYVHHDGKVGDFARTGLLYLIESTAHSETLERWVINSDLATLMASGLGALYSQLSRWVHYQVSFLSHRR